MVTPVYDCEIDAYRWILCTEKYFKRWGTLEEKKMEVAAIAMRARALTWWLWWYPRHQSVSWDAFTALFHWKFKAEWRVILQYQMTITKSRRSNLLRLIRMTFSSPQIR